MLVYIGGTLRGDSDRGRNYAIKSWERGQNNKRFRAKVGKELFFLHTRSGFPLFLPCEIILSHIPIPAPGKDKK